jgi:hypothetical protein
MAKGNNNVADLDIFGEEEATYDSNNDIFGEEPEATEVEEEVAADETLPVEENIVDETLGIEDEDDEDIVTKLNEILGITDEQSDTTDAIEEIAESTDNPELQALVGELRQQINEVTLKLQESESKNDVLNSAYTKSVSDNERNTLYKGTIDKLEANPNLMLLAKHFDNPERKDKVIDILADMLGDLTGQDIASLVETSKTDAIGAALNTDAGSTTSIPKETRKKKSAEENNNDIFGL